MRRTASSVVRVTIIRATAATNGCARSTASPRSTASDASRGRCWRPAAGCWPISIMSVAGRCRCCCRRSRSNAAERWRWMRRRARASRSSRRAAGGAPGACSTRSTAARPEPGRASSPRISPPPSPTARPSRRGSRSSPGCTTGRCCARTCARRCAPCPTWAARSAGSSPGGAARATSGSCATGSTARGASATTSPPSPTGRHCSTRSCLISAGMAPSPTFMAGRWWPPRRPSADKAAISPKATTPHSTTSAAPAATPAARSPRSKPSTAPRPGSPR